MLLGVVKINRMLALSKSCFNVTSMHSFFCYQPLVSSFGLNVFTVRYNCDANFRKIALLLSFFFWLPNFKKQIPGIINLSRDRKSKTDNGSFTTRKPSKRYCYQCLLSNLWHCFCSFPLLTWFSGFSFVSVSNVIFPTPASFSVCLNQPELVLLLEVKIYNSYCVLKQTASCGESCGSRNLLDLGL